MYRKALMPAALAALALTVPAFAQHPAPLPSPSDVPVPVQQRIAVTAPAGSPALPASSVTLQYAPATLPVSIQPGYAGAPTTVTQPVPVPLVSGNISAMAPMPAYMSTQGAPVQTIATPQTAAVMQPAQVYTPSYYYYYYQQPYQAPVAPVAPVVAAPVAAAPVVPVMPMTVNPFSGAYTGVSGPMSNMRGEMGHVRWPYYSYRRPWYFAGQPSFNVTIPGPVW